MNNRKSLYLLLPILLLSFGAYVLRGDIQRVLTYGWNDWPTHDAAEGCTWTKRTFSKIVLFEQKCSESPLQSSLHENNDGFVIQTPPTKYGYSFKLQLFDKSTNESPSDVVKEWYAKLTSDQQKVCEIEDANEPVDHFNDGMLHWTENPHPMPHKTRYKIAVKLDVIRQITDKYGGDPGSGSGYDYMCGHQVGTTWSGHPPYFEFDDRSPDKYLFVGEYGFEGPPIDLNSIRF